MNQRMTEFRRQQIVGQFDKDRLKKRLDRAKTERRLFEPLLDQAMRLLLPKRRSFYNETQGYDAAADIYDETGTNALLEFASRIHAGMTPNFTKFALLEAGPDVPLEDRNAINADLEEITDYLFEEIWASNFSQEVSEAYIDAGISTGNLLVERGRQRLFHHTAIPMNELYLEPGPMDDIGGMFRERQTKLADLPMRYPDAQFSMELEKKIADEPDRETCVVDSVWVDYSGPQEACYHAVFLPDEDYAIIRQRRYHGPGSNPFIAFRFGKASGETWGRGPALNTLPAVRTMNLTMELLLQNAAMSLVGMYHIDDDSVVNPETITLEPGAILPRMAGTRGLERIDTAGAEFNLSQIMLEQQALKIRKGNFNDMMPDPGKTPATAYEISQRMTDLSDRSAAAFGRMHYEMVTPYLLRTVYIAEEAGKIKMPTLGGKRVAVRATSPLAQAQGARDVQNVVQYHQLTTSMFGPQLAAAQYDEQQIIAYLRDRLSVPEALFLDGKKMSEKFAAIMMAQSAGMEAGGAPAGPVQLNQ